MMKTRDAEPQDEPQQCDFCGHPTGRGERDELFLDDNHEIGPLCDECYGVNERGISMGGAYRTALEDIAGYPRELFSEETPWEMRRIAERVLSWPNAANHPTRTRAAGERSE